MARFSSVCDEEATARFLKVSLTRFRAIRSELEEQHGFPKPFPLTGNWFRAELEEWVERVAYRDTSWGRMMAEIEGRRPYA
jgi:hypothetical protein